MKTAHHNQNGRRLFFWFRVLVSVVVLYFLARHLSWELILFRLEHLSPASFLVVTVPLLASTVCVALRWRSIVTCMGGQLRFSDAWSASMIGGALDQFCFSMSGDAYRAWWLSRTRASVTSAVASVILDRTAGILGIALLILAFIPRFAGLDSGRNLVWLPSAMCAAAFLGVGGLMVLDRLPMGIKRNRWISGLVFLSELARKVFSSPRTCLLVVFAAVTVHLFVSVCITCIANMLNVPLALEAALAVVPVAIFISMLPVSMGGWGVREGAMVVGLGAAGVSQPDAFAISLVYGLAAASVGAAGGLVWLARGERTNSKPTAA